MPTVNLRGRVITLSAIIASLTLASAQGAQELPPISVTGEEPDAFPPGIVKPDRLPVSQPDSADLLKRVPGGNVNTNGAVSGQAQYRGLFGPRINVQVDGMHINPGGPNWMDPPTHYAPSVLLQSLETVRGIAPVSAAGQSLGTVVKAKTLISHFTDRSEFEFEGDVNAKGSSVDAGYNAGGLLGHRQQ